MVITNYLTKRKIIGMLPHVILPIFLLILSKHNEKYYLYEEHYSLIPLYFVRVLLFCFGVWLSVFVGNLLLKYTALKREGKRVILGKKQKSFLVLFVWFIVWYGFWYVIYYPGSYTTDTLNAIEQFSRMKIDDWFSYVHPIFYLFLYQIYPKLLVISIAQILLCSFIYAEIISYFYSKFNVEQLWKKVVFIAFVALFSSITSITYYTFFYMRDIPYGLLHLYLAFYLFKICLEDGRDKISIKQLTIVLSLSLLLSIYRGEGWILLITIPTCLLLYGKYSINFFVKVLIFSFVAFYFLNSLVPKFLNVYTKRGNRYNLTLVAYPLGFILKEGTNYISSNYEEDKKVLSNVIDIEGIQKYTNCYDIEQFQHGGPYWNRKATNEEWDKFYERCYKIFRENPHLFFAARMANFVAHLFVFKGRAERTNDSGRLWLNYNECKKNDFLFPKFDPNFVCKSKAEWCSAVPQCYDNNGICGYKKLMILDDLSMEWHWNSTIALFLSILVLCLYKYIPVSAIASAVILCRIPLVFLTAPYAFFRYIFSLYLFGVFVLFFVALELTHRYRRNKDEKY